MTDSFNKFSGTEQGIYVVCSDKALLDKINKMLKRQGVLGVTDGEGKLHYMIDARKNKASAARQVNEFVHAFKDKVMNNIAADVPENILEAIVEETIDEVFEFYGFDRTLFGTKVLLYMVRYCLYGGDTEKRNLKELYSRAGSDLNMTVQQIERNVRYSIRGSQFGNTGVKTLHIIQAIVDAVKVTLASKRIRTDK